MKIFFTSALALAFLSSAEADRTRQLKMMMSMGKGKGCQKAKRAKNDSPTPYKPFNELDEPADDDNCKCPCCDELTCGAFLEIAHFEITRRELSEHDTVRALAPPTGVFTAYEYGFCPVEGLATMKRDLYTVSPTAPAVDVDCTYETDDSETDSYGNCCDQFNDSGCTRRQRRDRRLNEDSAKHHTRRTEELEDGMSVHVESEKPETLDWLKNHVAEMKERLQTGDATREWDELFEAYFENAEDIDMNCDHNDDSVQCIYTSTTKCGRDLIKGNAAYHNEIAEKIRSDSRHSIFHSHEAPESCQE